MKLSTLCYLQKDGCYLMLLRNKKKNDVNKNKWIGVGGKLEYGEAPEECIKREVMEETALSLNSLSYRGLLTFIYEDREPEYIFTYTSDDFLGELSECDEGELAWIPKDKLFSLELWEGDRELLRLITEGDKADTPKPFSLKFCYDKTDKLLTAESLLC